MGKKLLGICSVITLLLLAGGSDQKIENDAKATIPLIDEYDEGMSQAHFISINKNGIIEKNITEYDVSFKMALDNNEAYFVLGDEDGEYGRLALMGIRMRQRLNILPAV